MEDNRLSDGKSNPDSKIIDMDEVDESLRYNGVNGEWEEPWSELSVGARNLWSFLGQTESNWDDEFRVAFTEPWSALTNHQRRAATMLCFTERLWNAWYMANAVCYHTTILYLHSSLCCVLFFSEDYIYATYPSLGLQILIAYSLFIVFFD